MTNRTIILSSPNQKLVVTKKTLSDADHTYSRANVEATLLAASVLSDNAFKLYVRMNLHQNDFTYALSPVAIEAEAGISVGKYRSAVKELIRKGYLVLAPERKNLYIFYEHPQKDYAGFVVGEPNANTADHGAETEDHGAYLTGHAAETAISPTENEEMGIQVQHGNPTDPNTEIPQDITVDTENNIPEDNEEDILADMTPEEIQEAIALAFAEMDGHNKSCNDPYGQNYFANIGTSTFSYSGNDYGEDDCYLPF